MSKLTEKELIFRNNPVKIKFKTLKTERVFLKSDTIVEINDIDEIEEYEEDFGGFKWFTYHSIRRYAKYLNPELNKHYGFDFYYLVPAYNVTEDGVITHSFGEKLVSKAEFMNDYPDISISNYEPRLIDSYIGCNIVYFEVRDDSRKELATVAFDLGHDDLVPDVNDELSIDESMDHLRSRMKKHLSIRQAMKQLM